MLLSTSYHWSFIVGPKIEVEGKLGMRYHAKERPKQGGGSEWYFEERNIPLAPTYMLLARVISPRWKIKASP